MPKSMKKTAIEYARRGFAVFPCHTIKNNHCTCGNIKCKSPGKHPLTPNGVKDATKDIEQIEAWWTKWPDANIAIATGGISGITVLDVDVGPQKSGEASLKRVERENEPLPLTPIVRTGGGGLHYYFRYQKGLKNAVGILPGLDIRNDGGYVIAPPSIHISGQKYGWLGDQALGITPLAPFPPFLLKYTEKKTEKIKPENVLAGVPEGERDTTLFRYACQLRARGIKKEEARAIIQQAAKKCTPPFPPEEADKKVEQAWSYGDTENIGWDIEVEKIQRRIGDTIDFIFFTDIGEIVVPADKMLTSQVFRQKAIELNKFLPKPKQKDWDIWINQMLQVAETIEADPDVTLTGELENILVEHFHIASDDEPNRIMTEAIIKDGEYLISWKTIRNALKAEFGTQIENQKIADALKKLGGTPKQKRIFKGQPAMRVWTFDQPTWDAKYEEGVEMPIPF